MFGYSDQRGHVAEEITLLCDSHHRQKTNGPLPIERVQDANNSPHNLATGTTTPHELFYSGETCIVMLGDSVFLADLSRSAAFAAIVVEDQVMVGFQVIDEHLLFSLELHDDQGNQVLAVVRNELVAVTSHWDMTFEGTTLTIRLAPVKLLVEIDFKPPDGVWLRRGRFLRDGIEVLVSPSKLVVGGAQIERLMAHNNRVGAGIVVGGSAPISAVIRIAPGSRDLESDPQRDLWLSEAFPE